MRKDFYTGLFLPKQYMSKEHIVPRSLLRPKHHSDKINIVTTDIVLNSFRSNYRFAEIPIHVQKYFPLKISLFTNIGPVDDIIPFYSIDIFDRAQILSAVKDDRNKLFYPLLFHHQIALIATKMMIKYPYLDKNDIFDDPLTLRRWIDRYH